MPFVFFNPEEKVRKFACRTTYYRGASQKQPLGLGHAVWCARRFIGDEPFAVLLGDDVITGSKPCLKQLIEMNQEFNGSVLGVQYVPTEEVHRYGIVGAKPVTGKLSRVTELIEKPSPEIAPSNLAIVGRYVLSPTIFSFLENGNVGIGGEVQLTDALIQLNEVEDIYALEFEGRRYDIGEKFGFIEATLELAMQNPELRNRLTGLMERLIGAVGVR